MKQDEKSYCGNWKYNYDPRNKVIPFPFLHRDANNRRAKDGQDGGTSRSIDY